MESQKQSKLSPVPAVGGIGRAESPPEHSGRDRNTQENVSALKKLINCESTHYISLHFLRMKTKIPIHSKKIASKKCLFIFTCFRSKSLRGIGGTS